MYHPQSYFDFEINLNYGRGRQLDDADARYAAGVFLFLSGSDMDGSPYGMEEDMMGEDMDYGQEMDPYG